MKIPFDIKYKPQIESGEYKVETRDGKPVRIICWDMDSYNPIVALIANYPNYNGSLSEHIFSYSTDGHYSATCSSDEDLFIVTPEEELTDFEDAFGRVMMEVPEPEEKEEWYPFLKEKAAELLSLAREQFIKDGYVIEKKTFHDTVEKVDQDVMKEVSENIDFENLIHNLSERYPEVSFAKLTRIAKVAYQKGKAEALNDLSK